MALAAGLACLASSSALAQKDRPVVEFEAPATKASTEEAYLSKKDLAALLGSRQIQAQEEIVAVRDRQGRVLYVKPTLRPDLQKLSLKWVESSQALQAALVLLDPDSGQVLALAGRRCDGHSGNAALDSSLPAASVFKMVTAAAAVEEGDLSADSPLAYDGAKHTLYKNNLNQTPTEGRNATTLRESFAHSINTVFGKLGAFTVGSDALMEFAKRFGFNQRINFEMPVEESSFIVEKQDDPFHLAELASGFNRSTRLSPLHGALLAAAVATGGEMPEPMLVQEVFDLDNNIYYQAPPARKRRVVSPEAASELARLMRAAAANGTGRRTFGNAAAHPLLSQLIIGGKSGSINSEEGHKVEWFVAYAEPKDKKAAGRLALSAVLMHNGTVMTTSQRLVRDAIAAYYRPYLEPSGSRR